MKKILFVFLLLLSSFVHSQRITEISFRGNLGSCQLQYSSAGPDMESAPLGHFWVLADPSVDITKLRTRVSLENSSNSYAKVILPESLPTDYSEPQLFYTQLYTKPDNIPQDKWKKTLVTINKLTIADLPIKIKNTGVAEPGYAFVGEPVGKTPYCVQLHTDDNAIYLAFTSTADKVKFEIDHVGNTAENNNAKVVVEQSVNLKKWSQIESVPLLTGSSPAVRTQHDIKITDPEARFIRLRVAGLKDSRASRKANFRKIEVWPPVTIQEGTPYTFENNKIPAEWSANQGGQIDISSTHSKHMEHSLKWTWENKSTLRVTTPVGISTATGMIWWIYNETPSPSKITFNLYSKGQIIKSFDYDINFKGWRAFGYSFGGDAKLPKGGNPDMIEIQPSSKEGTLFIDCVEFSGFVTWAGMNDLHITCINQHRSVRDYVGIYKTPRPEATKESSDEERQAIELIKKRYEQWLIGEGRHKSDTYFAKKMSVVDSYINSCKSQYPKYKISRQADGSVKGVGLYNDYSPYKPRFYDISQDMVLGLVLDYKLKGSSESRDKVLAIFDYFHDQGWAEGSGMGSLRFEILRFGSYCQSLFLMRDELKKEGEGKYSEQMRDLYWMAQCGKLFQMGQPLGENADDLRSGSIGMLSYVLMEEDAKKQVQLIDRFRQYIENGFAKTAASFGTIKVDGSGYHHNCVYNTQYATEAVYVGALFYYLFRDTPFALSATTYENLKEMLSRLNDMSYFYDVPGSTGGRFPDGVNTLVALTPAYAYLALSKKNDAEMISMAKRFCQFDNPAFIRGLVDSYITRITHQNSIGAVECLLDIEHMPKVEAKEPQTMNYLPYSGLLVSRYKDWLVTIKGFSKYVIDYECISNDGAMTRFMSYGHQQISNESKQLKSYTPLESWDWARFPGSTAKNMPTEELKFNRNRGDKERNFSDEPFLGGTVLNDSVGMIAHKLHDNANDKSFRVNKTTFVFANLLVNIGSNINNTDKAYDTETTLFQDIQKSKVPLLNNSEIASFSKAELSKGKVLLENSWGNYYIVYPFDNSVLEVSRKEQTTVGSSLRKTPAANYDVACINHGKSPVHKGYRYATLLGKTKNECQRLLNDESAIQFLQQDSIAHIVRHADLNVTAYAIFNSQMYTQKGMVEATARPVILMIKQMPDHKIELSVSDPDMNRDMKNDLALPEPVDISITLSGNMKLMNGPQNSNVTVVNGKTTIKQSAISGSSYKYTLLQLNR